MMAVSPPEMSPEDIDALVAQVGDEILARLSPEQARAAAPEPQPVEGWELPDLPLAARLDLDLTAAAITPDQIVRGVRRASQAGLRAVWTTSAGAAPAERGLRGSSTTLGVVIGHPSGAAATPVKAHEAELALTLGAAELDLVPCLASARDEDDEGLYADIRPVAEIARAAGAPLTVTLEPSLLSAQSLPRAAAVCLMAGASALRLSTGRNGRAAVEPAQVSAVRAAVASEAPLVVGDVRSFGRLTHLFVAGARRAVSESAFDFLPRG